MKFLLASLKTLINSKDCSGRRIKFLFWLFFALFGGFSPIYIYGRLSKQFLGLQVAFRTTFKVTGPCPGQNKLHVKDH
jgi:hypothetical protein